MGKEDEHQEDNEDVPNCDENSKILEGTQEVPDFVTKRVALVGFDDSEGVFGVFGQIKVEHSERVDNQSSGNNQLGEHQLIVGRPRGDLFLQVFVDFDRF